MPRRTLVPTLLVAGVALTACGSSDDGSETIDGTGYRTQTPPGWTDATNADAASSVDADRYWAKIVDRRIQDNIIITRQRPPASVTGRSVGQIEARVRAGAAQVVGAPTPPAEAPTTIDGEDARTWTFRRREQGRAIVQRQLIALHDGILYTVTFSSLARTDESAALLKRVRDSWTWD